MAPDPSPGSGPHRTAAVLVVRPAGRTTVAPAAVAGATARRPRANSAAARTVVARVVVARVAAARTSEVRPGTMPAPGAGGSRPPGDRSGRVPVAARHRDRSLHISSGCQATRTPASLKYHHDTPPPATAADPHCPYQQSRWPDSGDGRRPAGARIRAVGGRRSGGAVYGPAPLAPLDSLTAQNNRYRHFMVIAVRPLRRPGPAWELVRGRGPEGWYARWVKGLRGLDRSG